MRQLRHHLLPSKAHTIPLVDHKIAEAEVNAHNLILHDQIREDECRGPQHLCLVRGKVRKLVRPATHPVDWVGVYRPMSMLAAI